MIRELRLEKFSIHHMRNILFPPDAFSGDKSIAPIAAAAAG
jgi:hypothetical protein